jgi:hypothetical protein
MSDTSSSDSDDPIQSATEALSCLDVNDPATITPIDSQQAIEPSSSPKEFWFSSIWQSCKTGQYEKVQRYLETAENPQLLTHSRDRDGNTALIIASSADDISTCIIEALLNAGADIDAKNLRGRTALMEASIWGRHKTVELLLDPKWPNPPNIMLRDNCQRMAIYLAGTDNKMSFERYRKCRSGKYVEIPFMDNLFRRKIVKLLQEKKIVTQACQTVSIPPATRPRDQESHNDQIRRLRTELGQAQSQILKLKHNNYVNFEKSLERWTLIDKQEKRLLELGQRNETVASAEDYKRRFEESQRKLARSQKQAKETQVNLQQEVESLTSQTKSLLDEKEARLQRLYQQEYLCGRTKVAQFRETKWDDGSFLTDIELVQTFRIGPGTNFKTGQSEHQKIAIAHMELDGVRYLAKNGKHSNTQDGFIHGRFWSSKAMELFRGLHCDFEDRWFQHVEPQLMAFYVCYYFEGKGLKLADFVGSKEETNNDDGTPPLLVQISVSREICWSCKNLANLLNATSIKHAFKFALQHTCV